MKKRRAFCRTVTLLLSVVLLASCLVTLPASALGLDEVEKEDFLWHLDFARMTDITDNLGSLEYSLEVPPSSVDRIGLVSFDDKTCLGIEDHSATYYIHDDNNMLSEYGAFFVEANMYFAEYPTAQKSDSKTPNEYPLSFLTWMTKTNSATNYAYRSIRIDGDGYLCTQANATSRTDVQLPLKEWFNIRFVITPSTGYAEVYVNNRSVLTYSIGKVSNLTDSIVRFFDTRYEYTVYFSDLSVYSDNAYRINLRSEDSADYFGYQTKPIDPATNTFDIRFLSTIEPIAFAATEVGNSALFSRAGYEVLAAWFDENGERISRSQSVDVDTVYRSISSENGDFTMPNGEYIHAFALRGVDASLSYITFAVRPFTVLRDGSRRYGEAAILTYSGKSEDGRPVLNLIENASSFEASPSEDTFVKKNDTATHGEETTMLIKNASGSALRHAYIKFALSDVAMDRLMSASRVYLQVNIKTCRTATAAETEAGGIEMMVYGTETGWRESALTYSTRADAADISYVGSARYRSGEYVSIDVTDYVLAHAKEGAVSFRLANAVTDGSSGATQIYSSESKYAPRLVVVSHLLEHEVNLGKIGNEGYEPWGYAEALVAEWIGGGYDELFGKPAYKTIDLNAVNNSSPIGDYTVRVDWKGNTPTASWNSKVYARTLDTLSGFVTTAQTQSKYDAYGGITNAGIRGNATGYFHTETIGNRTYIIDPLGYPYFAVGINTAEIGSTQNQIAASMAKYGSEEAFYEEVSMEMRQYGINTVWGGDWQKFIATENLSTAGSIGCISKYMSGLGLGVSTGGSAEYMHNNTMNVFDPDFVTFVRGRMETVVAPYADDPRILGWYSDNEIPAQSDMLYCYLTVDPSEPVNAFSYATAWTFLAKRTGNPNPTVNDVTAELSEEFKSFVYDRYYDVITSELRKVDTNHMYMGNRIHSGNRTSEGYLRAASKYLDVITVNLYGGLTPSIETIKYMYRYSGKPFLVTEFFAKADDAVDMNGYSLGNQTNAGSIVKTQTDRANFYENYTLLLLESQTCVGWTWYRFRDNDQTIYQDAEGNLYRVYDYKSKAIYGYVNVETGELIDPPVTMNLTVYYKGESDTSNLGSNKGIYDNHMNPYTELLGAHKRISDNIFNLIEYFDVMH